MALQMISDNMVTAHILPLSAIKQQKSIEKRCSRYLTGGRTLFIIIRFCMMTVMNISMNK